MPRPILRLATRATRRTRATAWGIAFACMVLVASLSLVAGLQGGMDSVTDRLGRGPAVYIHGDDLLESRIAPDALVDLAGDLDGLRVHTAVLEANGVALDIVVASLEHFHNGTGSADFPTALDAVSLDTGLRSEILEASGQSPGTAVNLTLLGLRLEGLPVAPPPPERPAILPATWAYVRPELLVAANATSGGDLQALVTEAPVDSAAADALGLSRLDTIGAIGFFRGSVEEANAALAPLVLVIAAVIALLVYAGMSLEVHQRTREIRLLRSLGAGPRAVAALFEARALRLAGTGAVLGSAVGVLLAHGIVSVAPIVGLPNLVILEAPVAPVTLALATAVLAGAAAGLVPSRRAAVVARRGEVGPS